MTDSLPQMPATPPLPANEPERLAALHRYNILDTPPEAAFDRITRLAARLFDMPIALISLVDKSRAWFKSCVGFAAPEVPREDTLCSFAVLCNEPLIVPDTRLDDRFACNPFVQSQPGVRFYAGAPLLSHDGFNLGTLCLLDSQPHNRFTPEQQATLVDLAAMVVDELELRLAAHRVAQSEKKYHSLFESIDEGFCICKMLLDEHGKPYDYQFLEVNSVFAKLTGLEAAAGKTARQLVPNVENDWIEIYGSVVQTGEPVRFEQQSIALNRWFDVNAFCVGEPQEKLFAILFTEITDRKQFEQEQQRFFAIASDLQVITKTDGYFQWVSPTFERLLGWTPAEMTSRPWTDFVHPDDINPSISETTSLFSGNATLAFENRYRHKNGSYRWFMWKAQPDLERQVIYGAAVDITDRKQAELQREQAAADLRASEERYRAFVTHSTEGIWRFELEQPLSIALAETAQIEHLYRYAYLAECNQVMAQMYGFSSIDEIIGVRLGELLPQSDPRNLEYLQTFIRAGYRFNGAESYEVDRFGNAKYFTNNLVGMIEDDHLIRAWGNQQDISERKQREAELAQLNAQIERQSEIFNTTLSTINDYIYNFDRQGRFLFANQILLDLWGLTAEEALGKTMADLHYPKDVESKLLEGVQQVFSTGKIVKNETFYTSPAGESGHFENILSPFFAVDGTVEFVVGSSRDITDRKQAEAALRQSEERHRFLVTTTSSMVWIANSAGEIINDVPWWQSFTGQTPQQYQGYGWLDALHPDDLQPTVETWTQAQQTKTAVSVEYRVRRHDGHYHYMLSQGVPILDADGNVREWMGVVTDINDRKQAELELRQKNAILDVINESAPAPIFVKDRQGRIIYANPATLQVLGKSAAEVVGYRDCDLYPNPEDAARVMENDRRVMESGQTEVVEESPDGVRTFLGMKAPYRNEAGEVIGLIGISNDITDRVQIERDRERLLQQEQVAREAADRANQIKDEFLAVLSHELRSPLNPILGWTRMLQSGRLDAARQAEALATIERNAKLQTQLIEDLLDISRIMRGKLTLTAAPVDLSFVISAAIETVRLAAEARRIEIQFIVGQTEAKREDKQLAGLSSSYSSTFPPPPIVQGDATRLQQVVWNLLSNAIKFTPPGGRVEIQLSVVTRHSSVVRSHSSFVQDTTPLINDQGQMITNQEQMTNDQEQTTDYAQITVTDAGIGISPDFLPHVFEYFRQEDSSTTRKFGGLGLGLAIVRQIVELHGGTVAAASWGDNQGATFTVQLPLLEIQELAVESRADIDHSPLATRRLPLAGLQILMVDDDEDTREFQAFVVEQSGAKVTAVASGLEALQVLDQFIPDAIVSDVGMADMDGYMLIEQIRSRSSAVGGMLPAIALTAYAGNFDQERALQAGFQAHLTKPVEPGELVAAIVELLQNGDQQKLHA